jgi:hypothetical protein
VIADLFEEGSCAVDPTAAKPAEQLLAAVHGEGEAGG